MALIAISALGSRGDVQPLVGLGLGLVRAGHRVRILTHPRFEGLVRGASSGHERLEPASRGHESRRLEHVATGEGFDSATLWEGPRGLRLFETVDPVLYSLRLFRRVAPFVDQHFAECLEACRDADVIVGLHTVEMASASVAEALDRPYVALFLSPPDPRYFHGPLSAKLHEIGGALGCHLVGQRRALARARRRVLGLGAPRPLARRTGLVGISRAVVPPPPDWNLQVTGYWFAPEPAPSDALRAFVESGEPPVCIGFGSMPDRDPDALARMALSAIGPRRAVFLGSALTPVDDARVLSLDEAPHAWLLPRCAAFVHHGGAGATAAALRAGVPSVVMPRFGDQPFWARRLHELGVAPPPIGRQDLDPDVVEAAIRLGSRARLVASRIEEDGVAKAVTHLDAWIAAGASDAAGAPRAAL